MIPKCALRIHRNGRKVATVRTSIDAQCDGCSGLITRRMAIEALQTGSQGLKQEVGANIHRCSTGARDRRCSFVVGKRGRMHSRFLYFLWRDVPMRRGLYLYRGQRYDLYLSTPLGFRFPLAESIFVIPTDGRAATKASKHEKLMLVVASSGLSLLGHEAESRLMRILIEDFCKYVVEPREGLKGNQLGDFSGAIDPLDLARLYHETLENESPNQ